MREDVLHVWRACESIRVVYLGDSAIGVCRQVKQIVGDIRQEEAGETSEPIRPCMDEFGREFVAAARQSPRCGAISRVHARRTQRDRS